MVRLDELASYAPGTDPNLVVHATHSYYVPILANGEATSSVTVVQRGGKYETAIIATDRLARSIARFVKTRAAAGADRSILVRIPALHLTFIGFREGGQLMLAAAEAAPHYGIEAEKVIPAEQAFQSLAPAARNIPPDQPG
jgi:hypothetical protein